MNIPSHAEDTMTQPDRPFVLIHGSWHTGDSWRYVLKSLSERGYRAYAPTLAGHGPGVERGGITLADLIQSVVTYIVERDLRHIILVGHSLAGIVLPGVAAAIPERIQQLIFLDALVLEDGERAVDTQPELAAQMLPLAENSPDFTLPVTWEYWQALWHDPKGSSWASPERAKQVFEQDLFPEPMGPYLAPVAMQRFRALGLPSSYLLCRQDTAFGDQFWHDMALRLGSLIFEMDGGHEVLYTRPDELADQLIAISRLGMQVAA